MISEDAISDTAAPTAGSSGRTHLVDTLTWRLAIANLIAQIGIIGTGGLVRLTGSGLGCSTWPMCEPGQFAPVFHEATSYHPFVEFGNRTMTGVLSVIAIALLVAVYLREPVRHRPPVFRVLAWSVLALIGVQALLGGLTVHADLHPAIVGSHMYLSLALVAVSAYLVARLGQEDGAPIGPGQPLRLLIWIVFGAAAVMLILGVITTGTGPHSGDDEVGYRFALDPLLITRTHSASVWVFIVALAATTWVSMRSDRGWRRWMPLWALTAAQGVVGYVQYFNGLPILLVFLHMVLAALMVAALTMVAANLWPRGATLATPRLLNV